MYSVFIEGNGVFPWKYCMICAIYDSINDSIILSELYLEDLLEYTFSECGILIKCTHVIY